MGFSLDDIWMEHFGRWDHLTLVQRRRIYRVFLVIAGGICYFIDTAILFLFHAVGTIEVTVVVFFGLAGLGHTVVFSVLQWSGFSERFSNPHMSIWQMAYAFVVLFISIALAPRLLAYFLALVFVVFGFATLRISFREAIFAWLFCCLLLAAVLLNLTHASIGIGMPSSLELAIIWLAYAIILLRTIALGYYGTMLRVRIFEKTRSLEGEVSQAEELATHDVLTNTFNRRVIIPAVEDQIAIRRRNDIPACVAMIDLDWFKKVNDERGHLVGDAVLKTLAERVQSVIRETDKLGRYGGEEFLLVMPFTNLAHGVRIIERIRLDIAGAPWREISPGIKVTVSCGITEITPYDNVINVIERADDALIMAKRSGRNRTCSYLKTGAIEFTGMLGNSGQVLDQQEDPECNAKADQAGKGYL